MGMAEMEAAARWCERAFAGELDDRPGHAALKPCSDAPSGGPLDKSPLPAGLDAALPDHGTIWASWSGVPVGLRSSNPSGAGEAWQDDVGWFENASFAGRKSQGEPIAGGLFSGSPTPVWSGPTGTANETATAGRDALARSASAAAPLALRPPDALQVAAASPALAARADPDIAILSAILDGNIARTPVSPVERALASGPPDSMIPESLLGRGAPAEAAFVLSGAGGAAGTGLDDHSRIAQQMTQAQPAVLRFAIGATPLTDSHRAAFSSISDEANGLARWGSFPSAGLSGDVQVVPSKARSASQPRTLQRRELGRSVSASGPSSGFDGRSGSGETRESPAEGRLENGTQSTTMITLRGNVNLDGRKMGAIVAAGQISSASLPTVAASAVNLRALPIFRGTGLAL